MAEELQQQSADGKCSPSKLCQAQKNVFARKKLQSQKNHAPNQSIRPSKKNKSIVERIMHGGGDRQNRFCAANQSAQLAFSCTVDCSFYMIREDGRRATTPLSPSEMHPFKPCHLQ